MPAAKTVTEQLRDEIIAAYKRHRSYQKLANEIGIHKTTIYRFATSNYTPKSDVIDAIVKWAGMRLVYNERPKRRRKTQSSSKSSPGR